jgi:probable phosphoglycerate mutase
VNVQQSDVGGRGVRQQRFRRPAGATEVLLVRHGESAPAEPGVAFDLVDGHGDPPLHPDGRDQAQLLAGRLGGEDLAALYVTTLRRTAETAAPLAARLGLVPVVEADLREVHLGEWEGGVFRHRVAEGHPIAAAVLTEERWDVIPGAEPRTDFAARVRAGLLRVVAAHPDRVVAVFTHGGVIGELLAQATGSRPFAFVGADNASISHLVVTPERWALRRYNDTTHLGPRFAAASEPPT